MSLGNVSYWNNDNLQNHAEEVEEVGYFAALNLNYNCTDAEIKRNYEDISYQLQSGIIKQKDSDAEMNENFLIGKVDPQMKKKLVRRVNDAFKVLSNEHLRKQYLEDLRLRCYLSQIISSEELIKKYSGRVFPYYIFELHKKSSSLFHESSRRFFHFNFIEMTMEERKEDKLVRAFNFSAIQQAVCGFKANELYLSVTNGREVEVLHYQVKHEKQCILFVEMILFAKNLANKHISANLNKEKHPTIPQRLPEKSSDEIVQDALGVSYTENKDRRSLRLLNNDRIVPAKHLFQCEVHTKGQALLSSKRKLWLHLGTSQILLTNDKSANQIVQMFPIDKECISVVKSSDPGSFIIICAEQKHTFRTLVTEDTDRIFEVVNHVFRERIQNNHIIHSLPYNKKDLNVMKMLTRRMSGVNAKIKEVKEYLNELRRERECIKLLFAKEKEKTKMDHNVSKDTYLSRISCIAPSSNKIGPSSLERLASIAFLPSPRSPQSKTINEEASGSSNSQIKESKSSMNKILKKSKSMSFSEKVFEFSSHLPQNFEFEHERDVAESPDFKRSVENIVKKLEIVQESPNANDYSSDDTQNQKDDDHEREAGYDILNLDTDQAYQSPRKRMRKESDSIDESSSSPSKEHIRSGPRGFSFCQEHLEGANGEINLQSFRGKKIPVEPTNR